MFSLSSWFSFPSISLPASIQNRFLSYFLKRSLGHLLKPGQLDAVQIDSQIGSGFVHINNLELDQDAINTYLKDSPLILQSGSIGKVSIRLPWSSILSDPVELSVSSLSLTFSCISPQTPETYSRASNDLAASVTSVAESFLHEELSTRENEDLRRSLHLKTMQPEHPPGSLNPFLSTEDLEAVGEDGFHLGDDADISTEGVSLIAVLLERLLSKVRFDGNNIEIRIVLPDEAEVLLRTGEIVYKTQGADTLSDRLKEDGEVRAISLSSVSLHIREFSSTRPLGYRSRPISPGTPPSEEDDDDDDAMIAMSQSLAFLPPRQGSPSTSPDSSIYHSAASSVRAHSPPPGDHWMEKMILSTGNVPNAIVLRLITPRLLYTPEEENSPQERTHPPIPAVADIRITLHIPPIAVALSPRQVRSLIRISEGIMSHSPPPISAKKSQEASLPGPFNIKVNLRAITLLALLPSRSSFLTGQSSEEILKDFFLHSTSPPSLPHIRIHADTIDLSTSQPSGPGQESGPSSRRHSHPKQMGSAQVIQGSVADFSVFLFSNHNGIRSVGTPVLITDPFLNTQHPSDSDFTTFEVTDWTTITDTSNMGKTSRWRVRPTPSRRKTSESSSTPSIQASFRLGLANGTGGEIDIVPLHVFLDTGFLEGLLGFVDGMTPDPLTRRATESQQEDTEETPVTTPRQGRYRSLYEADAAEDERIRVENLVIRDFIHHDPNEASVTLVNNAFVVSLAFLRVEIRASPVPTVPIRSGVVVMDLHKLQLSQQRNQTDRSSNVGTRKEGLPTVLGVLELEWLHLAMAAPKGNKAAGFLSIKRNMSSYKNDPSSKFGIKPPDEPSPFSICLRQNSSGKSQYSLDVELPTLKLSMSKIIFDHLAYWADDISRRLFSPEPASPSEMSGRSRDVSMIGSRYFAKGSVATNSSDVVEVERKSEFATRIFVEKVHVDLLVPSKESEGGGHQLVLDAIDANLLAEIKPEGKDETILTVGITDLTLSEISPSNSSSPILRLTVPYDVLASSNSLIKLRYVGAVDPETFAKETRVRLSLSGFTYFLSPDISWMIDLGSFFSAPEGAFDTVIPSECTKISVKVRDGSLHISGKHHPGALVLRMGEVDLETELVGQSSEIPLATRVLDTQALFIDDTSVSIVSSEVISDPTLQGIKYWKRRGYALFAEADKIFTDVRHSRTHVPFTLVTVSSCDLGLHICADTLPAVTNFASSLIPSQEVETPLVPEKPVLMPANPERQAKGDLMASVDETAFTRPPDLGSTADMIYDDLPQNLDYLDSSYGLAGGVRELPDEEFHDSDTEGNAARNINPQTGVISNLGGETIRMLDGRGIHVAEGHFESNLPDPVKEALGSMDTKLAIRIENCDLTLSLYDGYDWLQTRQTIEQEIKAIRIRLRKIKQLLASGQTADASVEQTSALLFNSVPIGLAEDPDEMEPEELIAAINEELRDDATNDNASQSSWQSFKPSQTKQTPQTSKHREGHLERSRGSQIDFRLHGIRAEIDQFHPNNHLASKVLMTAHDLEILDNMKTSTWKKFLTSLRTDFRGNVRETDSDMVRVELRIVHPVPGLSNEEGRLRAKILPIKLHVDQDALDFLKKFFSFQSPQQQQPSPSKTELYFQHVEVFPVDLKLDYKPKRVDYRALREGKTIELMNFFHFDGSEITLRHITLSGITGWPRLFDTLNDLWTPDVKANQLADIISGVSPVRSFVNVGSGVADLVLLPIAQYKKGKVGRGLQQGTTSFVKTTAIEAVKLGARLATGTQIILEQAETVLGGQGQFRDSVTAEAVNSPVGSYQDDEAADLISKYADQPQDVREGLQYAYKSLSRNLNSAAQTILAVPMEVYERSGNEGPVRAVVRAVPIAVLKPMIGASEAVSKTLIGLRNTMDPDVKHDIEAKYKQR